MTTPAAPENTAHGFSLPSHIPATVTPSTEPSSSATTLPQPGSIQTYTPSLLSTEYRTKRQRNEDEDEDDDDEDDESRKSAKRTTRIAYIADRSRRHTTFSKRKAGLIKKAYELTTLTGTQALLLIASESGHVYSLSLIHI